MSSHLSLVPAVEPSHEAKPEKEKKSKEKTFRASIRVQGKPKQKRFPNTVEGKRDAKEWLAEIQHIKARWRAGLEVTKDITLGEYAKIYVERRTPETQSAYLPAIRTVIWSNPALSNLIMSEAKRFHFQHLFGEHGELRRKGLAIRTVNTRHSLLSAIFTEACKEPIPYCLNNPLKMIPRLKLKGKAWKALDPELVETLLKFAKEHRAGEVHLPLLLAVNTGLRASNLVGLRWRDIDFERGTITIREMLTKFGIKKGLKGRRGQERVHPLGADLARQLKEYKANARWSGPMEFVVPGLRQGEILAYHNLRNRLLSMAKEFHKSGALPARLHWHVFRHSFAVEFLRAGGRIEHLKEFLDHEEIQTTQIYGKIDVATLKHQAQLVSFGSEK